VGIGRGGDRRPGRLLPTPGSGGITDTPARIALAAHVWRLTLADGGLSQHGAALLGRMATFLSLTNDDIDAAARQAPGRVRPS
jgi:hypothetical protein